MKTPNPKAAPRHGDLSRVAVKLFFAIADEWSLTEQERCQLAGLSTRTTLYNWKQKLEAKAPIKLSADTLERLSYIAGIYKALQLLFAVPEQWKTWIRKPNRDFGGRSALDRMLAGRVIDLADVRRYLDGWRGELYV
jgi:hypothetical protein